jgi:hypothetical protein
MTPSTKLTPPKWPDPQARETRSREERLAALMGLAKGAERKPRTV